MRRATDPPFEEDLHARAAAVEVALDALPPPRSPDMLLEKLLAFGVTGDHVVIDLGCGHGTYALQIAATAEARILALDVSATCVAETAAAVRTAAARPVHVARGVAEGLPVRDGAASFVWCRDMLNHVDLLRTMRECARVLVPGGRMLVYQTFATASLEPHEAQRIYNAFAIVRENMQPAHFEQCAAEAGFSIVERDVIGGEWREWWEADGSRKTSAALLRASRMGRAGDALQREFGEAAYEFALVDQLWGVYQMIGKLQPMVYVLLRS